MDLQAIARALGGEVSGRQVRAPGPGHSPQDRSLSIWPDPCAPDGFRVHSFAADDWRACRDYVRDCFGLGRSSRPRLHGPPHPRPPADDVERITRALAIWGEARDPRGTPVERYLCS